MTALEGLLDKYGVDYNPDNGRNQQVHCPFHEDTYASASVNLDEGVFKCFGCEMAGDAIALLMKVEGLEFREAKRVAEELAGQAGTSVSRQPDSRDSFLPRKSGSRPGRRQWRSPWGSHRP